MPWVRFQHLTDTVPRNYALYRRRGIAIGLALLLGGCHVAKRVEVWESWAECAEGIVLELEDHADTSTFWGRLNPHHDLKIGFREGDGRLDDRQFTFYTSVGQYKHRKSFERVHCDRLAARLTVLYDADDPDDCRLDDGVHQGLAQALVYVGSWVTFLCAAAAVLRLLEAYPLRTAAPPVSQPGSSSSSSSSSGGVGMPLVVPPNVPQDSQEGDLTASALAAALNAADESLEEATATGSSAAGTGSGRSTGGASGAAVARAVASGAGAGAVPAAAAAATAAALQAASARAAAASALEAPREQLLPWDADGAGASSAQLQQQQADDGSGASSASPEPQQAGRVEGQLEAMPAASSLDSVDGSVLGGSLVARASVELDVDSRDGGGDEEAAEVAREGAGPSDDAGLGADAPMDLCG